ncbi:MAG: L-lysine 6-transaminase [Candidatus Marinimicrobia bacterium]|nr:L-lysine 6-transaminase [Candidatus Neomarinimicrobiota bacterium]|tara:strand:+ start:11111 stop:12466 length:1356 start_codon:yes stop_codon:yes gene_type:complete
MSIKAQNVRQILSKNILADGFQPIMDLDKSEGSYIVDESTGEKYLDMFSMFASASVGYNHPRIIENLDLLAKVSKIKPTLSDLYNIYYADFLDTFNRVAIPDYLPHTFFIEGGSLAVENALKVAFDWKVRKNIESGKKQKGSQIIHFKQAFHGRSGYTMSLTNTTDPRKTMYFPKFDWPRIDNPYLTYPITDEILEDVIKKENLAVEQIKDAVKNNPDDIAGLIIEPIQGEGGDNFFRCQFLKKLRDLADEHEFLLIYDEVQTGIGITGKMWAHQNYIPSLCECEPPIEKQPIPDVLSFGKKTQVCGVLAGKRVEEVKDHVFSESSRINSTFGGNLVDMMRFKIILEIIEEENLLVNSEQMGKYLLEGLESLQNNYPAYITNSRGLGLWAAFDLPSMTERDDLWKEMMKNKLLILPSGDKSIRFRPHLNISKKEINHALEIIDKSIKHCLK